MKKIVEYRKLLNVDKMVALKDLKNLIVNIVIRKKIVERKISSVY